VIITPQSIPIRKKRLRLMFSILRSVTASPQTRLRQIFLCYLTSYPVLSFGSRPFSTLFFI